MVAAPPTTQCKFHYQQEDFKMARAIKFIIILGFLLILVAPNTFPAAASSGPTISHVCVLTKSEDMIALVVWPGAPSGLTGSVGSLTVSWSGGTFTIPLTYVSTTGAASKWQGVVPSGYTGSLVITSGWVLDESDTVHNAPFTFVYGASCTPTAVELKGISAHTQSSSPLILVGTVVLMALGLVVVKRH
jgi:hypothetical protein